MATLVLHTVGTALGGPIGGAIGSLLGASIDQQLFGRKGPRVGDLKVQGASYGSPIPRIYGTMRVAGCVIWATDLKSGSSAISKGQSGTSYSVSLAVALSSRPVNRIKRIWADGKLLRGAAGDFKVACTFRFYPGNEDQAVDPLIASVETMNSTPAYRGLALVVFENLQLADFGNRIPFMTFEVEADPGPPSLGAILTDASRGEIEAPDQRTVIGYAAYGDTIQSAIQPIIEKFGIQLFDDGTRLRSPTPASFEAVETELGCGVDSQQQPKIERSQTAARSLPSALTLTYYNPTRDYQTAQTHASIPTAIVNAATDQLPAVLDAASARALTETALARQWAERDTLRLRLPPRYLPLEPGMLLQPSSEPAYWLVSKVQIEAMALIIDLHSRFGVMGQVAADPGRAVSASDLLAQPTSVAILELPDLDGTAADSPVIVVAAANASPEWKPVPLDVEIAGAVQPLQSADLPTVLGSAVTILPDGQSALIDEKETVDVQLIDPDQWLESRDDDALVNGDNLAIIGNELVQFGSAVSLGEGKFRLSRLLRGRRGTEWAMGLHRAGETFAMIDPLRLQRIPMNASALGSEVTVTPHGLADSNAAPVSWIVTGAALRPPSPAHLSAEFSGSGDLVCSWCRRSRLGWVWIDGVDAPLGCSNEMYRVQLQGSMSLLQIETTVPEISFTAADVAALGSGLTLRVMQVGDLAASMPASIQLSS